MWSSHDFDEDQEDWDEGCRVSHGGRHVCEDCGIPLGRICNLKDSKTACSASWSLFCSSHPACRRCDKSIVNGELHFQCPGCGAAVCTACGPGVYIQRQYDFYDTVTGRKVTKDASGQKMMHSEKIKTRGLETGVAALAREVWENVQHLADQVHDETKDIFDAEWEGDLCEDLFRVSSEESVAEVLMQLTDGALKVISQEPTLNEVEAPCKVFGDIHGQIRDVMLFFINYGFPGEPDGPNFVFNGDFVDRGAHQVEVIGMLMALKILFPHQVFLNRGNHEEEAVNKRYGFDEQCRSKCGGEEEGGEVFRKITTLFNYLPLGALIGGRALAVHGGIGDGKWTLDQLRAVRRPLNGDQLQSPQLEFVWNVLWSDPIEEDSNGPTFGVHPSPRSATVKTFGWNVTQAFCEANNIDLVIRSHQAKVHGFGFDVMHDESLVRVFSARDYEANGNDGAILDINYAQADADTEPENLLVVRAQTIRSITKEDGWQ